MNALSAPERSSEDRFFSALADYRFVVEDMDEHVQDLTRWRLDLCRALAKVRPQAGSVKSSSSFGKLVASVHETTAMRLNSWVDQWEDDGPAQALSAQMGERCVLLVFGKVNAGKSSFCNFVAERFAARGHGVQRFYFDDGDIVFTDELFKEGATETTARIQGAYLGDRLVLLDTPGLHSVTKENGELTRRFTESGDAVIWLSSSTSPGQVQELDELTGELASGKLLLPVISKSDTVYEDEVDGEIVKVLLNKTPRNRDDQENDVKARTDEKLDKLSPGAHVADQPISVSVRMAREVGSGTEALDAAGFGRLFDRLRVLVGESVEAKKKRVPLVMVRHLERTVLRSLRHDIAPHFDRLHDMASAAAVRCEARRDRIVDAVRSEAEAALSESLEKHKATRDVTAVCREVSEAVNASLLTEVGKVAKDFLVEVDDSLGRVVPDARLRFEDQTMDWERGKGAVKRALIGVAGTGGAAWGAVALAGLLVPGPGWATAAAIVGAALGGAAATKVGELVDDREIVKHVVGTGYSRLQGALQLELKASIESGTTEAIHRLQASIKQITESAEAFRTVVDTYEQKLLAMKDAIQR